MLYCYWDMVCDKCNCYFSFCPIFCPFNSLTAQKIKISKKWRKHLEISSFYTSVPKIMIICYTVTEIWCVADGQMDKRTNGQTNGWTDRRTDRQTGGRKKWHIEVGSSRNKNFNLACVGILKFMAPGHMGHYTLLYGINIKNRLLLQK